MQIDRRVLVIIASLFWVSPFAIAQEASNKQVTLEGTVVDPDGKPVAGVGIYLAHSDLWHSIRHGYGTAQVTPELLGRTDSDGRFRVQANQQDVARSPSWLFGSIIAVPPKGVDLGVDWNYAYRFNTSDKTSRERAKSDAAFAKQWGESRTLRLPRDDVPLRGRLVRKDGTAVVGAKVRVVNIQQLQSDDLKGFLADAQRGNPSDYDVARNNHVTRSFFGELGRLHGFGDLMNAVTDSEGRFTIRQFGRNRIGWLVAEHESIVTDRILVRSQTGPPIQIRDVDALFTMHPAEFDRIAQPSLPLEGTVRDQDSKAPIRDAMVENLFLLPGNDRSRALEQGHVTARTDKDGRYRLTGLPIEERVPLLVSSQQAPYLPMFAFADMPGAGKAPPLDVHLKQGIWTQGCVKEGPTSLPVWGNPHYFAFRDNPHFKSGDGFNLNLSNIRSPFITDVAGRYQIACPPGHGLITFTAIAGPSGAGQRYPTSKGQEQIEGIISTGYWARFDTVPIPCIARSYHAVREIRPTVEQKSVSVDISLVPAARLTIRLLDPEGKDVTGAWYSGAWEQNMVSMQPMNPGGFHVADYDETFPRRLNFCHPQRELAATIVLKGKQQSPVEIKLQPAGSLVGQVMDDSGKPLSQLFLHHAPQIEGDDPTAISALPKPEYRTNEQGRFEIRGLAPGVKYNLVAVMPDGQRMQIVSDTTVESGKTTDVGSVKPAPLRMPQLPQLLPN